MNAILAALRPTARFKARSHDTSKQVHIPLLQSRLQDAPDQGPTVVLIGDSMFERMTTTGESPNSAAASWPSPQMLGDDEYLDKRSVGRLDRVFNAGVGGDKIQNVAYRLVGAASHPEEEDESQDLPGLLPLLAAFGTVKLWVVHAGTNNLSPKQGLRAADCAALETVVRALLSVNPKGAAESKVVVTGLFYRVDFPRSLVDRANEELDQMVKMMLMDNRVGVQRVLFQRPALGVKVEEHLVDHVHLNLRGYQLWTEELYPVILGLLS
ncbi:hypothetical protein C8A00DRAFT_18660 [Chaetomidium leptoderma]|uniref:SGNH hydrolase-type esterase domain-containing protein n=1 Tax=Chaetomidium leptoderma TaxID=669021 RepID=A0AAN6VE29_9PEZI|nr:hypothetical protein C8A00DRAFT_18660 [Chaetomidium leptoderma]